MINAQTLKGFRDFLPEDARKRQYVISTLRNVFELYGFEPLETPALEYEEILTGKYGEEGDKLMYRFIDNGGRKVAMRYDQTVPLARVVAQYGASSSPQGQPLLPFPFKRYQIQPVWRAENTQKGRFREFLQCDIDTVGTASNAADAEIVAASIKALEKLGFTNFKVLLNDRKLFEGLPTQAIIVIDKLKKIGEEGVIKELVDKKIANSPDEAKSMLGKLQSAEPTEDLRQIMQFLKNQNISENDYAFSPTLARGLDYYTGLIFEIEIDEYTAGSVCGGGRYDNLVGMFTNQSVPAVGCAFGFDRILDAMEQFNLFPKDLETTKVLITIFSKDLSNNSAEVCSRLRSNNINTEIWLDAESKMEKQLKYADAKKIPYTIIVGPDEAAAGQVTLRDMKSRNQQSLTIDELIEELKVNIKK